jgi:hypothetical protein
MRHKLLFVFLSIIIQSCAIPTKHDVVDYQCVNFKGDFAIIRSVDTCPLLSVEPKPKTLHWDLHALDSQIKENIERNKKHQHKLNARSCDLPTSVRESKVFGKNTKLSITKIITRNDTVSYNRMFIYGNLIEESGNTEEWLFEQRSNKIMNITERVDSSFNLCVNET